MKVLTHTYNTGLDIQGMPLFSSNTEKNNIFFKRLIDINRLAITCCIIILLVIGSIFSSVVHANAGDDPQRVLIVHQSSKGYSQRLINDLSGRLADMGIRSEQMTLDANSKPDLSRLNQSSLILTVGSNSTQKSLESGVKRPILSVLMPRRITLTLRKKYSKHKNWSNLLIDQPLERQFRLITEITGPNQNVGILLSDYTKSLSTQLQNIAKKQKHKIIEETISDPDQLNTSLKNIYSNADVLLTLADPIIYNRSTIRGILLSSYRNKLPIIGFSNAYVKAGAIAAIHTTPEQVSAQSAKIIQKFFRNGKFKKQSYLPDDFSVAVNKKVAHSLGIQVPDSSVIIKRIKKAEKKR